MAPSGDIDMQDASPAAKTSHTSTNGLSTSAHPPTFDLGNLLVSSSAPLPPNPSNAQLNTYAQSHAQSLINELLTTCRIHLSASDKSTVLLSLPPPTTPLPREKSLPKPKEKTKWEKFAEKKGIAKDGRKDTAGNKVYDEATGEWVPKWGYKGKNKAGEGDWIVEVDDKEGEEKLNKDGKSVRGQGRRERKEKVKRQERMERKNDRKVRKGTNGLG